MLQESREWIIYWIVVCNRQLPCPSVGYWISLCVKCGRMVDSVPIRHTISSLYQIQSDHLLTRVRYGIVSPLLQTNVYLNKDLIHFFSSFLFLWVTLVHYRSIIFKKSLLFTISLKYMTDFFFYATVMLLIISIQNSLIKWQTKGCFWK